MTVEQISLKDIIRFEDYRGCLKRIIKLCEEQKTQDDPEIYEVFEYIEQSKKNGDYSTKVIEDLINCAFSDKDQKFSEAYHGQLWQKDAIAYLKGENRAADDTAWIKVAIVKGGKGRIATLKVDRINCTEGDPVLQVFPCAENMSFVETDTDVKESYTLALGAAIQELKLNKEQIKANFRWSLLAEDGLEITALEGGSLGAAFSLLFYRLLEVDANNEVECEDRYV